MLGLLLPRAVSDPYGIPRQGIRALRRASRRLPSESEANAAGEAEQNLAPRRQRDYWHDLCVGVEITRSPTQVDARRESQSEAHRTSGGVAVADEFIVVPR